MTTTAYDDQFSAEPEPVHQPYDVAEILRQNIADLEKELKRQKERAENAEAKLAGSREDLQCWIESRNGWMDRAHAAEMELKAAREQERELCAQLCEWLPVSTGWEGRTFAEAIRGIGLGGELSNGFAPFNPIPAPVVPTDAQIHAAYRVALGQSIRERDMPEIRKFAIALLQSAGGGK